MAMSGITLNEKVVETFNQDMKIKKKHAYLICMIKECPEDKKKSEVMLENQGDPHEKDCDYDKCKATFDTLKDTLKDDEPRYIIYDFRFKTKDGRDVDKIGFIFWNADAGGIKKKMMYSSTKEAVSKKLSVGKTFQVNDKSEMDFEEMVKELQKMK